MAKYTLHKSSNTAAEAVYTHWSYFIMTGVSEQEANIKGKHMDD